MNYFPAQEQGVRLSSSFKCLNSKVCHRHPSYHQYQLTGSELVEYLVHATSSECFVDQERQLKALSEKLSFFSQLYKESLTMAIDQLCYL